MSKICDQCGRGSLKANSRSHSNIATRRRQHLNLQTRHLGGKTARVCAACLKSREKVR